MKEAPLTLVIDKHQNWRIAVGKQLVSGIHCVYAEIENGIAPIEDFWRDLDIHCRTGVRPEKKGLEVKTTDFHLWAVDQFSDVGKPRWFLRLRDWWRKLFAQPQVTPERGEG